MCQRRCEDHVQTRDLEGVSGRCTLSLRGVGRNLDCVGLRVEMPSFAASGQQTSDSAEPSSRRVKCGFIASSTEKRCGQTWQETAGPHLNSWLRTFRGCALLGSGQSAPADGSVVFGRRSR